MTHTLFSSNLPKAICTVVFALDRFDGYGGATPAEWEGRRMGALCNPLTRQPGIRWCACGKYAVPPQ